MSTLFHKTNAIVLVGLILVSTSAWSGRGFIYETVGTVSVANGSDTPRPAVRNAPVTSGMFIRTGDKSHAVLKFEDGQVVSLQANSTFKVREYIFDPNHAENNEIVFSLYKGGLHSVSGLICKNHPDAFRLATPKATVRIHGTEFFAALTKDGLYSKALSGSISVTNAVDVSIFTAGTIALTPSPSTPSASIEPAKVPADTFGQIIAIPVPPAMPESAPPPPLEKHASPDSIIIAAVVTTTTIKESAKDVAGKTPDSTMASETTSPVIVKKRSFTAFDTEPVAPDFYAGIQLGSAGYRYSNISNLGQIGLGLFVGYTINEKFSIEAKYNNLGRFESTRSTFNGSSFGVSGVVYSPVTEQFNIFGKLGIVRTRLKETAKPGFNVNHQSYNSGFTFGFGGQYSINSKIDIRAGVDIYPIGDTVSRMATANLVYIGSVFKF